jgi:hypothetical protein
MVARKKKVEEQMREGIESILGGHGREEAQANDYAIPMLRILQKMSPEVDSDDAAYVKGAKPGQIIHTISKKTFDFINIIPVHYRKTYIEWVIRENGGGFRGEYEPAMAMEMMKTTTLDDKRRNILPNGNQLAEHANYYVLAESDEDYWEPALISMTSSQLKTSRTWLSQLKDMSIEIGGEVYRNLDLNAYMWTLATQKLENDKGKWYGWVAEQQQNILDMPRLIDDSKATRRAVSANLLTYDRAEQQGIAEQENVL